MTVNTNTTQWSGGKGRVFSAANVSRGDVVGHLEGRGFTQVAVATHFGDSGTEMEETIGVTAIWPGGGGV